MMKFIFGISIVIGLAVFGWLYNLYDEIKKGVGQYINDVKTNDFPNEMEEY